MVVLIVVSMVVFMVVSMVVSMVISVVVRVDIFLSKNIEWLEVSSLRITSYITNYLICNYNHKYKNYICQVDNSSYC